MSPPQPRPEPSHRWALAGGSAALIIAMGIGRFAYTPLLPAMQAALGFGSDVAGYLAAANYTGYLAGAILAAAVPRRLHVFALRLCLVLNVATTGAMALTDSLWAWGVLRTISGVASAVVLVLAADVVFRVLNRRRRHSMKGLLFAGVGAGIALSGVIVAETRAWGWDGGWATLGVLSLILLPVCWRGLHPPPDELVVGETVPVSGPPQAHLDYPVSLLTAAYFCEGLGYIVTATFVVAIVAGMPSLAPLAPYTWTVVGIAAIPSAYLWTAIAARYGLIASLIVAHLVQAVGILLPVLSSSGFAVMLSAVLFGATFTSISALALALGGQLAPERSGRIIGVLTAVFGVGQAAGPVGAGLLAARQGGFDTSLILAAAIVALGALFLLLGTLRRRPALA